MPLELRQTSRTSNDQSRGAELNIPIANPMPAEITGSAPPRGLPHPSILVKMRNIIVKNMEYRNQTENYDVS
jgi:hypothetical protein